jgi:hypothetical protein
MLVDGAIIPVDWESTMIGAGEIDLAALVQGWDIDMVEACKIAYASTRWPAGAPTSFFPALEAAGFYWAFRWLGDRPQWTLYDKRYAFVELRRAFDYWSCW